MFTDHLTHLLPRSMARRVTPILDTLHLFREVSHTGSMSAMLPSLGRGMLLQQGRRQEVTLMHSGHAARFHWDYGHDFPQMRELYQRAKQNQWDAEEVLDWGTFVDPLNPEVPLLPEDFLVPELSRYAPRLDAQEKLRLRHSLASWMLSQFLHGEQGALYAAAQVTESVIWNDGKLYGATQVVDEGRHVETFHRYLDEKMGKTYVINDNLFVIIDALMTESRWDMKFLGMQIMVEGLALGAFGTFYQLTREPLLKELLGRIIQDEARHVHYGVLALQRYITQELTERQRQEREEWAYEVALLMRNRFLAHEVYEEWFEGSMTRRQWDEMVTHSPGMQRFRTVMFQRLVPNLRAIGLLSPRIARHYADAGLLRFAQGADATRLDGQQMLRELDQAA